MLILHDCTILRASIPKNFSLRCSFDTGFHILVRGAFPLKYGPMIAGHFAVSSSVEKSGSTWFWGFGEFNPWDPAVWGLIRMFAAVLHWSSTIVADPLMNHKKPGSRHPAALEFKPFAAVLCTIGPTRVSMSELVRGSFYCC